MYHKECISQKQLDYLKKMKKRKCLVRSTQVLILIAFFVIWEIVAQQNIIDPFLFSQPSRMITAMTEDRKSVV